MKITFSAAVLSGVVLLSGCIPRIEVTPPSKPITIDMNVKIDHQITVKADKNVEQLLEESDEGSKK